MTAYTNFDDTAEPIVRQRLVADLQDLGVSNGDVLLVHSSLSSIGWVVGGARTVLDALLDAVGPAGTLVLPAFSSQMSDPALWSKPPIPPHWNEAVRAHMPTFDPARTPTRMVGRLPEEFRTWPGVRRSHHPTDSVSAYGPASELITASHPLDLGLGPDGPLGQLLELEAKILLLGVGHDTNTSLHLAELMVPGGRRVARALPVEDNGAVVWRDVPDAGPDAADWFPEIGQAFEATGAVSIGPVGYAESRLMSQKDLVSFAQAWLENRLRDASSD